MTRKIFVTVEATIPLPVRLRLQMVLNADEGASVEAAIKSLLGRRTNAKADAEVQDYRLVGFGNLSDQLNQEFETANAPAEWLAVAIEDALEYGQAKYVRHEVTDSK